MHRRLVGGVALTVLGAGLMVWALAFDGGLQPLGGGVFAVFIGVALLSPVIGKPIVTVIAWPYSRLFGTVGVLARENARRNPRRTAATASALMIGLALVTTMAVLGQSTKSSVDQLVSSDLKADYVVSNAVQSPFSATIATQIAEVPGVADAVPFRFGSAKVNGQQTFVAGFDGEQFSRVVVIDVKSGDLQTGDDGILVTDTKASSEGWKVGDTVAVDLPAGTASLRVAGIIAPSSLVGADVVLGPQAPEALAASGEFPDEVLQPTVMGVAPGLGAHDPHAHPGEQVPVRVEVAGGRVEELETGQVRHPATVADHG